LVQFTDEEWIAMFDARQSSLTPEGRTVQSLTRLPNLMRRAKAALLDTPNHHLTLPDLQDEADQLRDELEPTVNMLRKRWYDHIKSPEQSPTPNFHKKPVDEHLAGLIHCHYLRTYGFVLAIIIFVNEVRLALSSNDVDIAQESHEFALEILTLARLADQYRPLGAYALGICLMAAEFGALDAETAEMVSRVRVDYANDFRGVAYGERFHRKDLQLICGREWGGLSPGALTDLDGRIPSQTRKVMDLIL
jgi:hypothetical protein